MPNPLLSALKQRSPVSCAYRGFSQLVSVLDAYDGLLAQGKLLPNESQRSAAHVLQLLQSMAVIPKPAQPDGSGRLPRGAYLYGTIGSGKSLLLDMFVTSQQAASPVKRLHYHEFMMQVHKRLHDLESLKPKVLTRSWNGRPVFKTAAGMPQEDPTKLLADEIANSTRILAVDELQVLDLLDAMLLTRLFRELHPSVILLFTSNQHPADLYKQGQSRKYFQPLIDMITSSLIVLRLESSLDYRRSQQQQQGLSTGAGMKLGQIRESIRRGVRPFGHTSGGVRIKGLALTGPQAGHELQQLWQECAAHAAWSGPEEIPVGFGRSIVVPRSVHYSGVGGDDAASSDSSSSSSTAGDSSSCSNSSLSSSSFSSSGGGGGEMKGTGRLAYFRHEELLGEKGLRSGAGLGGPLSAADYLAICKNYDAIFVEGIPVFQPTMWDEARRFVAFVDAVYESSCRIALSLSSEEALDVDGIFQPLFQAARAQGLDPDQGISAGMQRLGPREDGIEHSQSALRGFLIKEEEVLAFHRTSSRLVEMCS